MAELLGKQDEEAQIRRRLAFALWAQGDLHGACIELGKTVDLLEASRYLPHSEADQRVCFPCELLDDTVILFICHHHGAEYDNFPL